MLELSLDLRVGSVFLVFVVSACGFATPFVLIRLSEQRKRMVSLSHDSTMSLLEQKQLEDQLAIVEIKPDHILNHPGFRCIKAFSAGVILGVAILHLLDDAIDSLSSFSEYPLGLAMSCVGIILTLTLEQVFSHLHGEAHEKLSPPPDLRRISSDYRVVDVEEGYFETVEESEEISKERAFVKAIVLEVSVAVHSVIIGFGLGSLGSDAIPTIRVLMIALSFHQYFEGLSLGTALSETNLSVWVKMCFATVFSLTFPVGEMIGILTQSNSTGDDVQGFANAIAAGSLIYSCLVEMVAESFLEHSLRNKHKLKFLMIFSFTMGVLMMAGLAVWA